MVDGLDKAHGPQLKEVVVLHPLVAVSGHDALDQRGVLGDQLFLGRRAARLGLFDQLFGFRLQKHKDPPPALCSGRDHAPRKVFFISTFSPRGSLGVTVSSSMKACITVKPIPERS